MALSAAGGSFHSVSFDYFQKGVEEEFKRLLRAFYGYNYKETLAKGKLLDDEGIKKVTLAIEDIEFNLGIRLLKGEKN